MTVVDAIMQYGPTCIQLGLLLMCAYHFWQRNIVKAGISMTACVATFVLGW